MKLSPTKVGTWQACPRKYFLAYVAAERPTGRSWAHLSYGNAVHGALRDWFDAPAEARDLDEIPALVERAWSDAGFRDPLQVAEWKARAARIVRSYLEGLDAGFEPMSTERTLAFKAGSFVMEGRIDRLDEQPGSVAVVDYKTGRGVPDEDEVRGSSALAMYALMVQRSLKRDCFDVALHHVPSGRQVAWRHSPESLDRQLRRISEIAADIALAQDTWEAAEAAEAANTANDSDPLLDELFPAQPSALCGYCDFRDACAPGQARAARRESWDGLGEEGEAG